MRTYFTPEFYALYKKANVRIRNAFEEKLKVFKKNPNGLNLNNHSLKKEWIGHRSIDVNADVRAIFQEVEEIDEIHIYFVAIGTHHDLYRHRKSN